MEVSRLRLRTKSVQAASEAALPAGEAMRGGKGWRLPAEPVASAEAV